MRILIALACLFIATLEVKSQQADTLTNEMIIKLFKAGFSKETLKSKIQVSPAKFDVSIDGMIKLKQAGIPEEIINLMVEKPEAQNSATNVSQVNVEPKRLNLKSGLYYKVSEAEYLEIEPSELTSTKSNNAAQVLISPFIKSKLKATISPKSSSFEIAETSPKFFFIFDTTTSSTLNTEGNPSLWFSSARSPKEFLLVKLEVSGNSREITIGKGNAVSENFGIDDKNVIPFNSKKLANGQYEVTPEKPLKEGEYCIMFAKGIRQGQASKVYDFTIKKTKSI